MIDKINFSYGAYNSSNQKAWNNQSEKKEKSKIAYQLVKTGSETCALLVLENGKIVKSIPLPLEEAFKKYANGSNLPNFQVKFDFNTVVENSMESKSKEEAQNRYGNHVANNFFMQM